MRLCVIPARGGSKRIPRKNIRPFCGKSIIAWSIEAARASGCFERIVVSTDDAETAELSRQFGAEVPFVRPAALADDFTGTVPVVAHAIGWLKDAGTDPSAVCCLYATAPFVQAADLREGLETLVRTGGDYAVSVTTYAYPIQRALRLTTSGRLEMLEPTHVSSRSQDLGETYHDAGQFYWGRSEAWLAGKEIFLADVAPVIMPRHRVQDIDTLEDWVRAESMFATSMVIDSGGTAKETG